MKVDEELRMADCATVWKTYLGFLDFDTDGYMEIQNRLMLEQIDLWSNCGLGQKFLNGKKPKTVAEFREAVPLTNYEDYAEILLEQREDMLPAPPAIWIKTTWEGGIRPLKVAPYTQAMLDTYRSNTAACLILFGSYGKYKFRLGKKVMSGFAPLPYPTGLMGLVLEQKTGFELMPSREEAKTMSFSQQSKEGIKLSLKKGVDYFFSMGSVAYVISNFLIDMLNGSSSGGGGGHTSLCPAMIFRILRAKLRARMQNRGVLPKDLFKLTALVCAGTDNACYKDELEQMWGIRPMELFAGTEPTLIGCETWSREDIYFFPDACFYEFLPISQSIALHNDENAPHATCLISEVRPGEKYELIISVLKGGAFARYRTGDVYLCVGLSSAEDDIHIPRFRYVDRVPWVIDIAGFTRITEDSIGSVIEISHLPIGDWCAAKEFDEKGHPFLHIYLEMQEGHAVNFALTQKILVEHIGIYFKYMDSDYNDLKRLLGMDPLQVSVLSNGTFGNYADKKGHRITRINAPAEEIRFLRSLQSDAYFDSLSVKAEDYE